MNGDVMKRVMALLDTKERERRLYKKPVKITCALGKYEGATELPPRLAKAVELKQSLADFLPSTHG